MDWLVHIDERVFLAVNGSGGPGWDVFFRAITHAGRGTVLALLVIIPMAIRDRQKLRDHVVAMVLSVALGALAVEGVKWAVDRDRPGRHFAQGSLKGAPVRLVGRVLYERSFPSGHAQAAFGAATYVGLIYRALALPALGVALLVGLSRVYLGVHFPLDVLAGALFGIGFSVAGHRWRARSRSAARR